MSPELFGRQGRLGTVPPRFGAFPSVSPRSGRFVIFLMIFGMSFVVPPAAAQVVSGTLRESGSDRPVLLGRVALLDTTFAIVEFTYTNHDGEFVLRAPGPGDYLITAEALGYVPVIDGIIDFEEGGFLPVDVYIRPRPIELEGVTATVRRRRIVEKLVDRGFYDRAAAGFGHFVTPDEIEERAPADVQSLLRGIPGPAFDEGGVRGSVPVFRARGPVMAREDEEGRSNPPPPGYCYPRIYIDGILVSSHDIPPPGFDRPRIEDLVSVHDIVAVEVYPGGASAPLEWGGSQGNCGLMVFWTEGGGA